METETSRRSTLVFHVALLLLAALIYGAIFPVNRFAAEAGWQPLSFAFQQSLFAGLALGIIGLVFGIRPGVTWSHLSAYVVIGGLVVGLPMGLLVAAASHLDAFRPSSRWSSAPSSGSSASAATCSSACCSASSASR